MKPSTFKVISASAGSGKTFALTKAYLEILLTSPNPDAFRHILAITFTNKAVGEMKERIINTLKSFSQEDILSTDDAMLEQLVAATKLPAEEIHRRSKHLLAHILHNYGGFEISTIDSFIHRVIRTFAYELALPQHFEVELNQEDFLAKAVDTLISEADKNNPLTPVLVNFALEKSDNDKSYDIAYDLRNISKLLTSEQDLKSVHHLSDKTQKDFNKWKQLLKARIDELRTDITSEAANALELMNKADLRPGDFIKGISTYFAHLADGNYKVSFKNKAWQNKLEFGEDIFLKKISPEKQELIASLQSDLNRHFVNSRQLVSELWLEQALYKNLVPLSILKGLQTTLKQLKTDENKVLISDFNTIVYKEIKGQPVPYLFERLGERLHHFFIDEFQDTSVMQWQNLVPLLDNSLSGEFNSSTLVGDAKQAIYRWRGGEVGQFIKLMNGEAQPFQIKSVRETLEYNFRSSKTIVNFNNDFFKYLSSFVFTEPDHAELFQTAEQKVIKDLEGYVGFQFFEVSSEEDKNKAFTKATLDLINDCLKRGYNLKDLCILVRKRKHGEVLANYLSEHHIAITSSEALLLKNSPKVQLLIHILELHLNPENLLLKTEVLYDLAKLIGRDDKHEFISEFLNVPLYQIFKRAFKSHERYEEEHMPLYELVEIQIQTLGFNKESDAFIQFFLDLVLEHTLKRDGALSSFLDYFHNNEHKLSINTPNNRNAVAIMTIHKAKGLEFPVVIFPYAEIDIYDDRNSHIWLPLDPGQNAGFQEAMINVKADMEYYNETARKLYQEHRANLELDHLNLLYVALTRPVEEIHIICKKDIGKSGINKNSFAGLFISYLNEINLWKDSQDHYSFGSKITSRRPENLGDSETLELISSLKSKERFKIVASSGLLWDSKKSEAIEEGTLIHKILSLVKTKSDIPFAMTHMVSAGLITESDAQKYLNLIKAIVNHPVLEKFYTHEYLMYNERELLVPDGSTLRPDRLCISSKNEVVIIDYKTGKALPKHHEQLQRYKSTLREMGYPHIEGYLVYTNDPIEIAQV